MNHLEIDTALTFSAVYGCTAQTQQICGTDLCQGDGIPGMLA